MQRQQQRSQMENVTKLPTELPTELSLALPKYHPQFRTPPIQLHHICRPTAVCRKSGVNIDNRSFQTITDRCTANLCFTKGLATCFILHSQRKIVHNQIGMATHRFAVIHQIAIANLCLSSTPAVISVFLQHLLCFVM